MALSLEDPETDRLARELARMTGETLTAAVRVALKERLERVRRGTVDLAVQLAILRQDFAALPDYDIRTPDEICGYDETGMWS